MDQIAAKAAQDKLNEMAKDFGLGAASDVEFIDISYRFIGHIYKATYVATVTFDGSEPGNVNVKEIAAN